MLGCTVYPMWAKPLFKHKCSLASAVLNDLEPYLDQKELRELQHSLENFSRQLEFIKNWDLCSEGQSQELQRLDLTQLILQHRLVTSQRDASSLEIDCSEQLWLSLAKFYKQTERLCDIGNQILCISILIASHENLRRALPPDCKDVLTRKTINDYLSESVDEKLLKSIYYKKAEIFWSRHAPLRLEQWYMISPKELDMFEAFIRLTDLAETSSPAPADKLRVVKAIEATSEFLSLEFLTGQLKTFLKLDLLDDFLSLVILRLESHERFHHALLEKLQLHQKLLEKHQESEAASEAALEHNESLEKTINEIESIERFLFSFITEIASLVTETVDIVPLPEALKKFEFFTWLWSLIKCNKKKTVKRITITQKPSIPSKTEIQQYLEKDKSIPATLQKIVRKMLESKSTNLRKRVLSWLVEKGKLQLILQMDGLLDDRNLVAILVELAANNGLFNSPEAVDNMKIMIDMLISKDQLLPAFSLIQELINNSLLAKESSPLVNEILNVLALEPDSPGSVGSMNSMQLSDFTNKLSSLQTISLAERQEYCERVLDLLESGALKHTEERVIIKQFMEQKQKSCLFQQEIINELEVLSIKLGYMKQVLSITETDLVPFWSLIFDPEESFEARHKHRIIDNIDKHSLQIDAFKKMLEVGLWEQRLLLKIIIKPFKLDRLIIQNDIKAWKDTSPLPVAQQLTASIDQVIVSSSNIQTLSDLISLFDVPGIHLKANSNILDSLSSPEVIEVYSQSWAQGLLWPSNLTSVLTPSLFCFKAAGHDIKYLKAVISNVILRCELLNVRNPFVCLLMTTMRDYLLVDPNFQSASIVPHSSQKNLIKIFNWLWLSELLVKYSKELFQDQSSILSTFIQSVASEASLYYKKKDASPNSDIYIYR